VTGDPRAALARYIENAHGALDGASYYEILNVPRDAPDGQIRDAYYRLAARLHPDLHQVWEGTPLRDKLTSVYSRVTEAYRVLTNGERRVQYDGLLAEGKLRWTADDDARPKRNRPEDQIADAAARKFYRLGVDALATGNAGAAVMNLQFAQQRDPANQVIADALARAREGKS